MENLKSDKPIVAIETVPECSPFYEDLRSRNHLLGETKRKLAIRLYKECGLQIDWSTFQARRGLQTCWFTSEVCRWDNVHLSLLGEMSGQSMYTENAVNESPKADPFKED